VRGRGLSQSGQSVPERGFCLSSERLTSIASADAAIGLIAATAALSPDYLMLRGV